MMIFKKKMCEDYGPRGKEVLQEILEAYSFKTLEDAVEYFTKSACSFDHVPRSNTLEVLFVVEKPSIAKEVAETFSNGSIRYEVEDERKVYTFRYEVFGRMANIWIVSTNGYVCKQVFKKESTNGTGLYTKIVDVLRPTSPSPHFFEKLAHGCDAVILGLDNDHAGEAICFSVIRYLIKHIKMPSSGNRIDAFFRARFSSSSEVVAAIKKLDRPDFRRYLATIAKSHLDLRAGVLFKECQKYVAKSLFKPSNEKSSLGPCSAPCLALIVDRYHQAVNSPTKYYIAYKIYVNGKYLDVRSKAFDDEDEAKKICALQRDSYLNFCGVIKVPQHDKCVTAMVYGGLNTSELLQEQSKYYRRSVAETSKYAQKLYEMGLITYPRSETTKYPKNMEVNINQLCDNLALLNVPQRFNRSGKYNNERAMEYGRDKGNHPPIMPTPKALTASDAKLLSPADIQIYHYICRRLIASSLNDYIYSNETVIFNMGGGHTQEYSYFRDHRRGYNMVLYEHNVKNLDNDTASKLVHGTRFKFKSSVEKCPRPPLLKEYELIALMEKYKIGTDGSISTLITSIQDDGYVEIDPKTRELEPTEKGVDMIETCRKYIPEMIKPEYRANFIQAIEDIVPNGGRDFVTFYDETIREYHGYYQRFPGPGHASR